MFCCFFVFVLFFFFAIVSEVIYKIYICCGFRKLSLKIRYIIFIITHMHIHIIQKKFIK